MVRLMDVNRRVQIMALADFLLKQTQRTNPENVMRLLQNIQISFPSTTVTHKLAERFRLSILQAWQTGTLTRFQLITMAFPMLYESVIDLVDARRRISDFMNQPYMKVVFPSPPTLRRHA